MHFVAYNRFEGAELNGEFICCRAPTLMTLRFGQPRARFSGRGPIRQGGKTPTSTHAVIEENRQDA
jgi:hypothetical protein